MPGAGAPDPDEGFAIVRSAVTTDTAQGGMKSTTLARGFASGDGRRGFRSHIPSDRKFKIQNLFKFERGKADLLFSLFAALFAAFILLSFSKQSMFDHRTVPGEDAAYSFGDYMVYQVQNAGYMGGLAFQALIKGEPLGTRARKKHDPKLKPIPRLDWPHEGKLPRFGKILFKAPWMMPLLFLALLIPAALFNLWNSYRAAHKRGKEKRPNRTMYEVSYWLRSLEYVGYFIIYTMLVPLLGYLASTMILVPALAFRQGYRTPRWILISLLSAFAIVLVFRTGLQIKTPNSIWLYNQLPLDIRAFMLTYF